MHAGQSSGRGTLDVKERRAPTVSERAGERRDMRMGSRAGDRETSAWFRTVLPLRGLTVTAALADPLSPGSIAITGDVRKLDCDQALQLSDALLLAVMRMDVAEAGGQPRGREPR